MTERRAKKEIRPAEAWPVCPSCRRIQRENLDGDLVCPYERCDRYHVVESVLVP